MYFFICHTERWLNTTQNTNNMYNYCIINTDKVYELIFTLQHNA